MAQIEGTTGRWLLFLAAIAAVLAATGRLVVQPLFSAWIFFTLKREPERMRGLLAGPLDEISSTLHEIRACQTEQGEQIARLVGYLDGRDQ